MRRISAGRPDRRGAPELRQPREGMRIKSFFLVAAGFACFAADLNLIVGDVVLRETRIGRIAHVLDRRSSRIANSIVLLPGWVTPLVCGFLLLRPKHAVWPTAVRFD